MLAHIRRHADGSAEITAEPAEMISDEIAKQWFDIDPREVPFMEFLREEK